MILIIEKYANNFFTVIVKLSDVLRFAIFSFNFIFENKIDNFPGENIWVITYCLNRLILRIIKTHKINFFSSDFCKILRNDMLFLGGLLNESVHQLLIGNFDHGCFTVVWGLNWTIIGLNFNIGLFLPNSIDFYVEVWLHTLWDSSVH